MKARKFITGLLVSTAFAIPPVMAGEVIEIVTFQLKPGISIAEFASIDKAVAREHVARQPGFISRESAANANNEWLVIVHWKSEQSAIDSMATFANSPAAALFMSKIEASSMSMKHYQK